MSRACDPPGRCDLHIPCSPIWLRRLHFLDEVTYRDGLPLEFWGFWATPGITHSLTLIEGKSIWERLEVVRSRLVNMKRSICHENEPVQGIERCSWDLRPVASTISGTTHGRYLGVGFVRMGSRYGLYLRDDTCVVHRASCWVGKNTRTRNLHST